MYKLGDREQQGEKQQKNIIKMIWVTMIYKFLFIRSMLGNWITQKENKNQNTAFIKKETNLLRRILIEKCTDFWVFCTKFASTFLQYFLILNKSVVASVGYLKTKTKRIGRPSEISWGVRTSEVRNFKI